jgi:hypothetical protein
LGFIAKCNCNVDYCFTIPFVQPITKWAQDSGTLLAPD